VIRLLAIDIDGTLLDSRGRIPDANRQALADAAAAGVAIALVTGRSFHFTRPVAQALDLPLTLVVNNGAVVKNVDGTTVLRRTLHRDAARDVLAHTRAFEDSVAVVFDREPHTVGGALSDERQIVFERMDWSHPNRSRYYDKNKAYIASVPSLADALTEDPLQVMFNGGVEPMRQLVAEIRAMPGADRCSVAITEYEHRDFSLVDVNAAGCSKGTTLERWLTTIGVTPADVLAIGDNLNDLEMLELAGVAVVMGNAADAVKARGFALTGSNDEAGLAAAIRKYVRS
jgi:Cof subfamily protein (haloacid dehalogenase superfamily)